MSDPVRQQGATWPQLIERAHGTTATGTARIVGWREAVDPYDIGVFAQRLEWDGLTQPAVAAADTSVATADWLPELDALRGALAEYSDPDPALGDLPFARLLTPMVGHAWHRLVRHCEPAWLSTWSHSALQTLRHDLGQRLAGVAAEAWFADFTRDRTVGRDVSLRLGLGTGGDGAMRRWCREQAQDGLGRLLGIYPVMGRLLGTAALAWQSSTKALLQRTHRHWGDAGIEAVSTGLSDPHRGGHSVAILQFSSGERVVYKPKDLRIEKQYNDLVRALNAWLHGPALQTVDVVLGDAAYGFTSYLEQSPCPQAQLGDFYTAAGRLTGLLYVLGATDAHYENVIAAGNSLALIDPETLFHADLSHDDRARDHGVLRSGLLPGWLVLGKSQKAFDASAFGVQTPTDDATTWGWANVQTDDIVRMQVPAMSPPILSLPVPAGQRNPLPDHVDEVVRGFRDVHRACRDKAFGPVLRDHLAGFRGLPQRVVLRATRVYGLVQQQALSAQALTSVVERGVRLEPLSRAALARARRDAHWRVYRCELHDMELLDIPYFEHVLGTGEVVSAHGSIPGLIDHDPLDLAIEHLATLDTADMQWQERLIRGAIRARYLRAHQTSPPAHPRPSGTTHHADAAAATLLADVSASSTWLTLQPLPDGEHVRLGFVGDSWYEGRAGIAAAQRLAADVGLLDPTAADETARPLVKALRGPDPAGYLRTLGPGFSGIGGLLRWLPDEEVVAHIPADVVRRDTTLDLIGGVAGLLTPLSRMGTSAARRLLQSGAEHLVAAQNDRGGWPSTMGTQPLTGLSHGAAGCGLALLEAGVAMEREDWVAAGAKGFQYEASVFDPGSGNWPDFRHATRPMVAWCHGAAGIGLTRLRALQLLPDHADATVWADELDVAMSTTMHAPDPGNDDLCCGLAGRAAVLRIAGLATSNPRWLQAAEDMSGTIVTSYERSGSLQLLWVDPDAAAMPPGLMNGASGVAAHLLTLSRQTSLAAWLL